MSHAGERRRQLALAALLGLAALLFVVESRVAAFHAIPWLAPDSAGYLEANVFRAPLYPLILRALVRTPGDFTALGLFQHVALLASGTWLAWRFMAAYDRPVLGGVLALAVLANPLVVSYSFTVLPEAVFMSLLMAHLACVVVLASKWNRSAVIGLSASAALLAILKPAGYAVIAGLAIVALGWRQHWREFHWLVAPAGLLLLAVCAGNYAEHDIFATEAQGGYARLAYVGQLLEPARATDYPAVTQRIATQTAPLRMALDDLPSTEIRYLIGANEYHVVEGIVLREMLAEIELEQGSTLDKTKLLPSDPDTVLDLDRIGQALANAAIRARPFGYAYQVWTNFYGLWWLPLVQDRDRLPGLESEIAAVLSRHPVLDRSPIAFRVLPRPAYLAVRMLLLAIVVCAAAGFVLIWSSDLRWRVVGYVGILLNGYFLLVSLAQPGLPRYAIVVWPGSMVLLCAAVAVLIERPSPQRGESRAA